MMELARLLSIDLFTCTAGAADCCGDPTILGPIARADICGCGFSKPRARGATSARCGWFFPGDCVPLGVGAG